MEVFVPIRVALGVGEFQVAVPVSRYLLNRWTCSRKVYLSERSLQQSGRFIA